MPDPTLQTDPPVHTNPKLQEFIRARIKQRLREMGSQMENDPSYVEQGVQLYSKAGSPLVNEFYKQEETSAKAAAQQAMPHGGGVGSVVERTGRDIGLGALGALTDPGRFVMKHIGMGDQASEFEQWMKERSSDKAMGGRGLSSNPVVGTVQEAVEPAVGMFTSQKMIGDKAFEGVGNFAQNVAGKLPNSEVLQALAGTSKSLSPMVNKGIHGVVKGLGGGMLSMPDATTSGGAEGVGMAAGMGALSALSHVSGARAPSDVSAAPRPNPIKQAWSGLNGLFDAPKPSVDATAPAPAATPAPGAPPAVAPEAAPAEAGPTAAGFGGPPADWAAVDPETRAKVDAAFSGAKSLLDRAKLLGVEDRVGMNGGKVDPRYVQNLTEAAKPEDLFGHLQSSLLRNVGGKVPRTTTVPVKGQTAAPVAPEAVAEPVDAGLPKGTPKGTNLSAEPVAAPVVDPSAPKAPRKGTLKPKASEAFASAPRMEDGETLNWDKLDANQRELLTNRLGKGYREKVKSMNLANIQKVLNEGQFDTFLKALKMPQSAAPGAEVPAVAGVEPPVAPVTAEAAPVASKEIPVRRGRPVGKSLPVTPETPAAPGAAPPVAEVASAPEGPPAEKLFNVSGAWDGLPAAAKIPHLEKLVGDKGAASTQSLLPWEDLPSKVRAKLQGDPEVQAAVRAASDAKAAKTAGGAPPAGAGFPGKPVGKRRAGAKRKPPE